MKIIGSTVCLEEKKAVNDVDGKRMCGDASQKETGGKK